MNYYVGHKVELDKIRQRKKKQEKAEARKVKEDEKKRHTFSLAPETELDVTEVVAKIQSQKRKIEHDAEKKQSKATKERQRTDKSVYRLTTRGKRRVVSIDDGKYAQRNGRRRASDLGLNHLAKQHLTQILNLLNHLLALLPLHHCRETIRIFVDWWPWSTLLLQTLVNHLAIQHFALNLRHRIQMIKFVKLERRARFPDINSPNFVLWMQNYLWRIGRKNRARRE